MTSPATLTVWILRRRVDGTHELWQEGEPLSTVNWPAQFASSLAAIAASNALILAQVQAQTAAASGKSTTLTAQANSGQKNLVVASYDGFAVGDSIFVGSSGGTNEAHVIASFTAPSTIVTTVNLTNTYAIGQPVSRSPVEIVDARAGSATLRARLDGMTTKGLTATHGTEDFVPLGSFILPDGYHLNSVATDGYSILTGVYGGVGNAQNGHVWRSQDKGLTWEDMGLVGAGVDEPTWLASGGPGLFFAGCSMTGNPSALFRSEDGGATWVKIFTAPTTADATEGFSVTCGPGNAIFIGSGNQAAGVAKVWRSIDGGNSFSVVSSTDDSKQTIRHIIHVTYHTWLFAVYGSAPNESKIYRSTDEGATWTAVQTIASDAIWSMLALPNGVVLMGSQYGKVFRSTNNGFSFTEAQDLRQGVGTAAIMGLVRIANYVLAMVSDESLTLTTCYLSADEGVTWTKVSTMNALYHYHDPVVVDSQTVVLAGSHNAGPGNLARLFRARLYG